MIDRKNFRGNREVIRYSAIEEFYFVPRSLKLVACNWKVNKSMREKWSTFVFLSCLAKPDFLLNLDRQETRNCFNTKNASRFTSSRIRFRTRIHSYWKGYSLFGSKCVGQSVSNFLFRRGKFDLSAIYFKNSLRVLKLLLHYGAII